MLATAVTCLLAAGAALAQPAAGQSAATVKQVMQTMTIPLSTAVFDAAGDPPQSDAQWAALRQHALALVDAGGLLLVEPLARDKGEWMTLARAHVAAAQAVVTAATAKDPEAISAAGDALYETCPACHARYMDKDAPAK